MPIYVTLGNWTDQGTKDFGGAVQRANGFREMVEQAGRQAGGILTVLDLLRAAAPGEGLPVPSPRALASRTVETVMRPGVITLEASDRLDAALDLLIETRFHALPVVRRYGHGPVLVGMLEQRDLLPLLSGGRQATKARS